MNGEKITDLRLLRSPLQRTEREKKRTTGTRATGVVGRRRRLEGLRESTGTTKHLRCPGVVSTEIRPRFLVSPPKFGADGTSGFGGISHSRTLAYSQKILCPSRGDVLQNTFCKRTGLVSPGAQAIKD